MKLFICLGLAAGIVLSGSAKSAKPVEGFADEQGNFVSDKADVADAVVKPSDWGTTPLGAPGALVVDKPYGGGPGMLMKCGPWFAAVEKCLGGLGGSGVRVVMTSPAGKTFTQRDAESFASLASANQPINQSNNPNNRTIEQFLISSSSAATTRALMRGSRRWRRTSTRSATS